MTIHSETQLESQSDFLYLLAKAYPNSDAVCTEIINLQAILNLPKGTEHFLSDLHGEDEAFHHVLKNASGVIRKKLENLYDKILTQSVIRDLANLIYYPEEKLELIKTESEPLDEWYEITLYRLITLCKVVSDKYTRMKVRKALPKEFSYVIDEMLYGESDNKASYYENIIKSIIELGRADEFIIALAKLIQQFAIDHLHILGDIYDRGPGAHIIMDTLMEYHTIDIQWGNHDILWMGAAAGSEASIANVLRISMRYGNLATIEQGYGISLRPLSTFALETYKEAPDAKYFPRSDEGIYSDKERDELAKMHKAILIIQLKLEAEIILRRPEWEMESRLLLDKIDYEKGTVTVDGTEYTLNETEFPTVDPANPFALTKSECEVIRQLKINFKRSEKLQKHIHFLYSNGSMYLSLNDNLLFHGCILLNEDGSFQEHTIRGKKVRGKAQLDRFDRIARQGYFSTDKEIKCYGKDTLWYLWLGDKSPLFAKSKMATFERYFIDNEAAHIEEKNPYYRYRDDEEVCDAILREFGLEPEYSHIVNGHVPVKVKKGEKPTKANGKMIIIDGGLARAYQDVTGIGGYTLLFNSWGMSIISHEPFTSKDDSIRNGTDIVSTRDIVEYNQKRLIIRDTDVGLKLEKQIEDLKMLLEAYRSGFIKEK